MITITVIRQTDNCYLALFPPDTSSTDNPAEARRVNMEVFDMDGEPILDCLDRQVGVMYTRCNGHQEYYDMKQRKLGIIAADRKGVLTAYDANHRLLGQYDPRTKITTDDQGQKFGHGNQLLLLLGFLL